MASDAPTPLTEEARIDNSEFSDWGYGKSELVHADFARRLERRVAELEAERDWAERELLEIVRIAEPNLNQSDSIISAIKLHAINMLVDVPEAYEKYMKLLDRHMDYKATPAELSPKEKRDA